MSSKAANSIAHQHFRADSNSSFTSILATDQALTERINELCQLVSNINHSSSSSGGAKQSLNISIDAIFDSLFALYEDVKSVCMGSGGTKNDVFEAFVKKYEPVVTRIQQLRQNPGDFEILKKLGKGAFGEVHLVRSRLDGRVYAMKKIKKSEMLRQLETAFFMEERNILAVCRDSQWLLSCHCAFQDDQFLYLVMEFVPGGDLMSLLCRRDDGAFDEETARFYIAEIIMAVSELHSYNFVHRDIKPDNILLDANGHVKLADFGSCIALDANGLVTSSIAVGTPDYISPEILRAQEGNVSYGKECDWWSVGIVLYEILFGEPPFYADTLLETYGKIMNHSKHFNLSKDDVEISDDCRDLLNRLVCVKEKRLGRNGLKEIQQHPFFKSIDWTSLKQQISPFVPTLASEEDTSMFENPDEDGDELRISTADLTSDKVGSKANLKPSKGVFMGNQLPFIGFSFNGNKLSLASTAASNQQQPHQMKKSRTMISNPLSDFGHDDFGSAGKLKSINQKLEANVQSLISEVSALKLKLVAEASEKETLYKSLELAENGRMVAESENAQRLHKVEEEKMVLKKSLESEMREKEASLTQVQDLKREEVERKEKLLQETKIRFECEEKIKDLEVKIKMHSSQLAELNSSSDEALKRLKSKENSLQDENSNLSDALKSLELKFEVLEKSLAASNSSRLELEESKTRLQSNLEDSNRTIAELKANVTILETRLQEEEEQKNRLKQEEKVESANAALEVQQLLVRLEDSEGQKKKLSEQVSQFSKQIELLNFDNENKVSQLKREKGDSLSKIAELQSQLASESERSKSIQLKLDQASKDSKRFQTDLEDSQSNLAAKKQQVTDLQSKLTDTIANYMKKLAEAESMRDSALRQASEESSARRKAENQLDSASKSQQGRITELSSERDSLQVQFTQLQTVSRMKEIELQSSRQNFQRERKLCDSLQLEIAEWKKRMEAENKSRLLVQQELEVAQGQLEDIRGKNEELMEELRAEAENLANLEDVNEKLKKKSEMDALKISELVRKIESDFMASKTPTTKSGITGSLLSPSSLFSPKVDSEKKVLKLKQNEIKKLEQRLIQELSMRKTLEHEVQELRNGRTLLEKEIDEFTKSAGSGSKRSSISTPGGVVNAATSVLRRISNAAAQVANKSVRSIDDFLMSDSNDLSSSVTLEGWIKVPKVKGIRSGWTKYYAVVRDFSFIILEREKDKDVALAEGKVLFSIKAEAFSVRPAYEKELVHVTPKECSCIFQVKFSDGLIGKGSSVGSLTLSDQNLNKEQSRSTGNVGKSDGSSLSQESNLKDISKKIKQLKKDIEVEEKLYKGAESLARISNGPQRIEAEKQMEGSLKRLANLKAELERLKSIENVDQVLSSYELNTITTMTEEEINENLLKLEKDMAKEESVRDAILKIIAVTDSKKRSDLQKQLNACQKNIQNLKSEIDSLTGSGKKSSRSKLDSPTSRGGEGGTSSNNYDFNGHSFKTRTFTVPTACQHCHDTLWGFSGQGVECINCRFICHKNCYTLVSASCAETSLLKASKPLYIMAMDEGEQVKWVQGLELMRKIALSQAKSGTAFSHTESITSTTNASPTK